MLQLYEQLLCESGQGIELETRRRHGTQAFRYMHPYNEHVNSEMKSVKHEERVSR